MDIRNKKVLLTGANGGLGTSLIKALLDGGVGGVYAACRKPKDLEFTDPRVIPVYLNVCSIDDINAALAYAPDVDVLINNAGFNTHQKFLDTTYLDYASREMAVNYFGVLNVCRAFLPGLIERKGALVNILSILARATIPSMGSLCASKAAALRLTEGLRAELKGAGVQVLAVLPGVIDTVMSHDFPGEKASPDEVALDILRALKERLINVYPDPMSRSVAARLAEDRDTLIAEFSAYL